MASVRAYLLSVIAVSVLCSIALALVRTNGTVKTMIKLLSGILLTITVLQPIDFMGFMDLKEYVHLLQSEAESAAAHGTEMVESELVSRIKVQAETYIEETAAQLGILVTASVELASDTHQPTAVILEGSAAPYAKSTLQRMISDQLGIPKEAQTWP